MPACLGYISPTYNPQGQCETNYNGVLCTGCDINFSASSSYEC